MVAARSALEASHDIVTGMTLARRVVTALGTTFAIVRKSTHRNPGLPSKLERASNGEGPVPGDRKRI
eukprot:9494307-Pyramimonas_sp.AAC.1